MIAIVALTEPGKRLADQLHQVLVGSKIYYKPSPFAKKIQQAFLAGEKLIFICATGIVVRTLAPVLKDKFQDPPVLVLDEAGKFVIPLLSGHEGGANQWAAEVAKKINATVVMTTAKPYLNPVYSVGMGCERDCPKQELHELLMSCLESCGLTVDQISAISSIDIKADEVGLIELAKQLHKPFQTFSAEKLRTVESQLSSKSDYVFSVVGVYGVAESAALVSASNSTDQAAELILAKQKTAKATCAIARSYPNKE